MISTARMDNTHLNPVKHGLVAAPGGLAVFVVSSVRRRRAISCLGGGAAAMNRNRPANGSEWKRRRQGEDMTGSPSEARRLQVVAECAGLFCLTLAAPEPG